MKSRNWPRVSPSIFSVRGCWNGGLFEEGNSRPARAFEPTSQPAPAPASAPVGAAPVAAPMSFRYRHRQRAV